MSSLTALPSLGLLAGPQSDLFSKYYQTQKEKIKSAGLGIIGLHYGKYPIYLEKDLEWLQGFVKNYKAQPDSAKPSQYYRDGKIKMKRWPINLEECDIKKKNFINRAKPKVALRGGFGWGCGIALGLSIYENVYRYNEGQSLSETFLHIAEDTVIGGISGAVSGCVALQLGAATATFFGTVPFAGMMAVGIIGMFVGGLLSEAMYMIKDKIWSFFED